MKDMDVEVMGAEDTSAEDIGAEDLSAEGIDMSVGAAVEVGIRANTSWDDASAEM